MLFTRVRRDERELAELAAERTDTTISGLMRVALTEHVKKILKGGA